MFTPIPIIGMFFSLRSLGKIRRESRSVHGPPDRARRPGPLDVFPARRRRLRLLRLPDRSSRRLRADFVRIRCDPASRSSGRGTSCRRIESHWPASVFSSRVTSAPARRPCELGSTSFCWSAIITTCCFGDLSKVNYFDQMAVQITGSDRMEDTLNILRMGGILEINEQNLALGPGYPVFSLKADYAVQ